MGLPKTKTASATNDVIKCFGKINENVEVNRAPVRIRHSDSGCDTFGKENLITRKIKRIKRASPGFRFGLAIRVGPGTGVATTFTCPFGTFAFRKMPFGLCNAPGTFQRCMMGIFSDMIELILEIFMDDFSVFGDSYEGCLENLRKVLERCQEKNLVLNWEKCHFMVTQGIVLGHIVLKKGIEVDKAKVELISNLPTLKCVRDIRSFLGHAGFYRRFIKDFSAIASPLCNFLSKDVPFAWS